MGRHSRKGKAVTGRREERSQIPEHPGPAAAARTRPGRAPDAPSGPSPAAPPEYGRHPGLPGQQGTPAHGVPVFPDEQPARGGHPQHPEGGPTAPHRRATRSDAAGGGVGQGYGRGPGQGPAHGQVPRQRQQPGGPRQEYLDAFEEDVFAAGAPGAVPPGRNPAGAAGAAVVPPGPTPRQETGEHRDGAAGEPPTGPSRTSPAPEPGSRKKGSRARTATGIVAAAITTVLAVVVAAQVAGGEHSAGDSDRGLKTGERTPSDPDVPTDHERADRGARPTPGSEPDTYEAKMARQYPLADDLKGSGRFSPVPGHEKGPGKGEVVRYRVDIENGLPLDGKLFAQAVHKTLNDERSWAHGGKRSFERVSSGKAKFVITLASPGTTDVWCAKSGLDTSEEKVSCDSAATERIMINAWRWARGAETYGPDRMHAYRQMLVNHEVGHRLGHGHVGCSADGKLAPVMMQQTKYLTTRGKTCRINAWPYPRG
ncbi:DUF3152 domain-containing protein [Streptomyces smyrnaeus]|uniref:DUF3152 domain-containing protein n=1 Tax=Streptomyces smyrnaeus TaxID=1387713 RepID=A0ABS3XU88_9ACTN|nr:DUF3152 domain-containing protein [Streptomyces smyrnaeus]